MKLNGAEIIVKALEAEGIEIVSGIPGGCNLPLYDALYNSKIEHVLVRHEQAGGFIAQGMARSTGKVAVTIATSGPGVTNLLTAVADANHDSIPIVAISGQVPCSLIGTNAFQEVDTSAIFKPITKKTYFAESASDLIKIIPEALKIAQEGRPGPVVIDVPKNVQLEVVEFSGFNLSAQNIDQKGALQLSDDFDKIVSKIASAINSARRPLIFAGGGVVHAGAASQLAELANKSNIPVALSLMGLGSFDPESELYLGMPGMHGALHTNYTFEEADLLIALGVRFDDRAVGKASEFCNGADIIHIDIDANELNKIIPSTISLRADLKIALQALIPQIKESSRVEWSETLKKIKNSNSEISTQNEHGVDPLHIIQSIDNYTDDNTIITTDVGQHQMWVAQTYPFRVPGTFLTSGGMGTMGFGLPAAIGAALANPDKKVVCISGDGSFQMNIQELATLKELDLNVAIIILNNQHLGLVRQQQELFFEEKYIASKFQFNPNFADIALQYGIKSIRFGSKSAPVQLREALKFQGPALIDVDIASTNMVFPMVAPGAANCEMISERVPEYKKKAVI